LHLVGDLFELYNDARTYKPYISNYHSFFLSSPVMLSMFLLRVNVND